MNFRQNLKRLTVTAIMAAAACILSPLSIPLPISLVPISACTLVFYLFSYLLRARDCVVACLVYMFFPDFIPVLRYLPDRQGAIL